MCTFVLAWQVFRDAPVMAVANRDEVLDRPSEPPALRDWGVGTLSPKDGQAEGTWIGCNEHGVVVALTNRWLSEPIDGDRSRGLLVRDALGHQSAEAAARFVERELDAGVYDGFNLVLADASAAVLVEWDGARRVRQLGPGVHVVVNVGADGVYTIPKRRQEAAQKQAANADSLRTALEPAAGEGSENWFERGRDAVGDHDFGVCIHGNGFGTRSASAIRVDRAGIEYAFADGPPCETPFEQAGRIETEDHI